MITILDKHNCCGCSACVQVCPKRCINFDEDDKGFRYPLVDKESCIECGLCTKVCPCINTNESVKPLNVYAAKNPDDKIRKNSSSGGIFTMLAEVIIKEKGVVFGACFDKKWNVVHDFTESIDGLRAFRGSKYIQSRIGETYKICKSFLKQGRLVLFSGTPCQIKGLKLFLRRDYDNLITIDFICHGVPSPGVFRWYLQEKLDNYASCNKTKKKLFKFQHVQRIFPDEVLMPKGVNIKEIRFRDKKEGWKKYSFVLDLELISSKGNKNLVSLSSNVCENPFLKGFCCDLYLRPSCHQCPTRNFKSGSDITIGDFWGQEYMFPEFDNDSGVSSIIIKTQRGRDIFNNLGPIFKDTKSIDQVISYNSSLISSKPEPYLSHKFWKYSSKLSFEDCVKNACSLTILERIYLKLMTFFN